MASPAVRRSTQGSPASAAPFVEVFSRLRSQLAHLNSLLSSLSTALDGGELLSSLKTLDVRIAAFDKAAAKATQTDRAKAPGWEDELDRAGTLLWNKSTALRHGMAAASVEKGEDGVLKVVAELRRAGYRLIRLGSLEPLSAENLLSLLTLATKTSLALLAAEQLSAADALVKEAGAHVAHLEEHASVDPSVAKERAKILVAFYCCRIRVSMAANDGLGGWLKGKAEDLIKAENVPWREIEKLAETAYDMGVAKLRALAQADDDRGSAEAVEWLGFALELVEKGEGAIVQSQQVVILKALVEAYIAGRKLSEAEETLKQLLAVCPSGELRRRQIKLLLARKAGDGELVAAFAAAAQAVKLDGEEAPRLISLVTKLPDERRVLRFEVLKAIVTSTRLSSPLDAAQADFLNQLFPTAIFFLNESDRPRFDSLLDAVTKAAPGAQLSSATAFLCITYLWRQGDKAHRSGRYSEASEWFLLATQSLFGSLDAVIEAKTMRKAALCLVEAKEHTRAEQLLQRPAAGGDYAKTHWVRFYNYNMLNDTPRASAALNAAITAPDFTPQLLLWAAKTANNTNNKPLLAFVLGKLVEVCKSQAGMAGVDLMVVIRCLIRLYITRMDEANEGEVVEIGRTLRAHLEGALALARNLANAAPVPDTLSKDLAWLNKSSFNLCARYSAQWPLDLLVSLYSLTASLIELDVDLDTSTIESAVLEKLWVCKFAALSGQVEAARKANGAKQTKIYKALVADTSAFIDGLNTAAASTSPSQPHLERADALLDAAYAVKIEAQAATDDWKGLNKLVEDFEDSPRLLPVSLLKLATDKVTSCASCPRDVLCSVLRKTLTLLYARQDLDVTTFALWLRLIISALIDRNPDEAFKYVQNAETLIREHKDEYPQEEIDWLISTVWDHGLDAYTALSLPTSSHGGRGAAAGEKWCNQAVAVATAAGEERVGGMVAQLEGWHTSLKERFVGLVGSEANGDGDVEMA
ncbi:hypothetical protein JCM6882_007781 [Rhodosporidiobolus microsporus]